ncbi:MAG: hypothetical protein R2750_11955 [Bacteroidales bacterium]
MKTTKVILVAILMAFATIGFSQTETNAPSAELPPPHLVIKVSFANAMHNPALVRAMREQLNPIFLQNYLRVYVPRIRFLNHIYYISGTRNQWVYFFSIKEMAPKER